MTATNGTAVCQRSVGMVYALRSSAGSCLPGLLVAMMRALCENAHISFEGDLSRCRLSEIAGATDQETAVLGRNTLIPQQDFIVVPLEPDTVRPIMDRVLPEGRVVHDAEHIQIEKEGKLEFGAYDNFHPECIGTGPGVPETLLQDLKSRGVLRSYGLATVPGNEGQTTP